MWYALRTHTDLRSCQDVLLDHLGHIKLADFGASKILSNGNQKSIVLHGNKAQPSWLDPGAKGMRNGLAGTPMYMSPEVIRNEDCGRQDAMDIWSLGCVVLECATGRKPWNQNLDNEWYVPCVFRMYIVRL